MASFRKRSNGWSFRYELPSISGKRKQIERGGFRTKKEAERAYRELVDEYEKTGRIFDGDNISYSDYLDFWVQNYCEMNLKPNTINSYSSLIDNWIVPKLGHLPIMKVGPSELQTFLNDLKKDGLSKSSIGLVRAILTKSLKMAVYPYQHIKDNPMQYVTPPRFEEGKKKMKTVTSDEFEMILSLYPKHTAMHIALIIGYRTGMRIGEVRGLMWKDIDFLTEEISIERQMLRTKVETERGREYSLGRPKSSRSIRTISCDSGLISILKERRKWQMEMKLAYGQDYYDSDFVVTEKWGEPLSHAVASKIGNKVRRSLGIDFTFHSLRHTHASLCIQGGMDFKSLQQRLGHSEISITMDVYGHVLEGLKKKNKKILDSISNM